MRRAVVLAALFAVAASCGEPPAPAQAPAQAEPGKPVSGEFTTDDAQVVGFVFEDAAARKFDHLSQLTLPPRCDRVRIAVRALHDHLAGVRRPSVERAPLIDALGALAKVEGGASAKSLRPLVAAWRGWTDEQVAAEKDLTARAAQCLEALRAEKPFAQFLRVPSDIARATPPMSPATAQLQFFRAADLALDASGEAVPQPLVQAFETSQKLFAELGWPGGLGSSADELLVPLQKKNSKSFLATYVADLARAAYAGSGDELRAALVFLAQADAAERVGEFARAENAAAAARDRLLPTGARGRELVDVLRRHGELAQKVGKQSVAARELVKALEEAKAAGLDAKLRADVAERLATSLFRMGRFDEAYAVTREAAKSHDEAVAAGATPIEPTRTHLDELAAESASELGRAEEAAALYRTSAARYEKFPPVDSGEWRAWSRDQDLLLAARALARGGDADGAAKAVAEALAHRLQPALRAFAAGVLRDAGRLDEAEHELSRAVSDSYPAFSDAVAVELARLAAARGDAVNARGGFGDVVDRLTNGDADKLVGWELAEPLLDWARMEMGLGRFYEASELAGRAVIQLRGSGLEWELDRARKLYVDLQRRRGWFVDAEKATTQRLAAAGVGDLARREDVLLDLLFIRLELLFQKQKDAETNARATAAMFPPDWRRDLATDAIAEALKRPDVTPPDTPSGLDERSRWGLLRDLVAGKEHTANVAERAGAAEPELRRWALTTRFGAGHDEFLVEMRRRPDPTVPIDLREFVTSEDEAVLLVEPIGEKTIVRLLLKGRVLAADVPGDAGLVDFWDATWVAPAPANLDAAAKRVSEALFPAEFATELLNVRRLWISVSEPLGPLPFDLLTCGTSKLLTRFEVLTVNSLTELSRCRDVAASKSVTSSSNPYASLDGRNAIVQIGSVDAKARSRFLTLVEKAQRDGRDACAAVRDAKLAMREEWNKEPKTLPGLAPWAAFLLRGAP